MSAKMFKLIFSDAHVSIYHISATSGYVDEGVWLSTLLIHGHDLSASLAHRQYKERDKVLYNEAMKR